MCAKGAEKFKNLQPSENLPPRLGNDHLVGQLFELDPQVGVVQRQFNIPLGHVPFLAALLELALHGAEQMLQTLIGVGRRHNFLAGRDVRRWEVEA